MNAPIPSFKAHHGLAGHFRAVKYKVDSEGNVLENTAVEVMPAKSNLIVNSGLDMLATVDTPLAYCRIGTGTAEPTVSDTQLQNQVGATNTTGTGDFQYGVNLTDNYIYKRVTRRFPAGTIHGKNLSEVAMSNAATGPIFCRALLKDAMGNPLTIVLLEDEVLDIVYELRMYLPPVDTVVETVIDGAPATVTMRRTNNTDALTWWAKILALRRFQPYSTGNESPFYSNTQMGRVADALPDATNINSSLPKIFGSGPGTGQIPTPVIPAYVPGSYTVTWTMNWGLTQGNVSPAAAVGVSGTINNSTSTDYRWSWGGGIYYYGFDPPLNKTPTRVMQINVGISWGRYEPTP